jgi:SNF2 family DNA or RNA helicase
MVMKVQTDNDFMYFGLLTSEQRDALLRLQQAVKVKNGYRIPLNVWSAREVWQQFPQVREEMERVGKKLKREVDDLTKARLLSETPAIHERAHYHDNLRGYQNADIFYLKHLPAAGVFNEQRTGKTPTVIHLLRQVFKKDYGDKAVIVTPASLIYNWQREIEKWTPDLKPRIITGTKAKREKGYAEFRSGVLIISKDTLKQDIERITQEFDVIIVDEAHFLRNYKTAQSKAVFRLKGKRRYALTGTPTVKHPVEIFGILHFLYPSKYPSFWQFADRYFNIGDNYAGYKEVLTPKRERLDELQQIVGILSVQRKRREVMQWLPEKERSTFYCEMTSGQRKAYDEMLQYFFVEETELDAPSVLAQLIRLRQICLDPTLLGIDAPSGKTDALMEWLTESLPKGEGVVIMSMFTSYLKMIFAKLSEKGFRVGMIHGEMDNEDKMKEAEKFQNGEIDILLCNIISAGTGFTLDRAEVVIFTDKAYNPAENEQAEDRITPTTPDKVHKHSIISFVSQNSVDERINELLDKKKSLTDLINEGGLKAIKNLLQL